MDTERTITGTENNVATQAENKGEQKTFTQDDVNRIVQERLAKDRQKSSEELSRREQELAQREFRLNNRQKLIDRGYSEDLLEALNCSDEEAFNKALDIVDNLIKSRTTVQDQQQTGSKTNRARFVDGPRFTTPDRTRGDIGRGNNDDGIRKAMGI